VTLRHTLFWFWKQMSNILISFNQHTIIFSIIILLKIFIINQKDFITVSELPSCIYLMSQSCHDSICLRQPFSIFLPRRNPWNNVQVSGNPYIKIIISTAHGTLARSVRCRYNNPIITVNAVLSREWYFAVDLFILANKFKKRCFFFSITISRGTPSDISRNPGWETLV
jgi:hypothetical protein